MVNKTYGSKDNINTTNKRYELTIEKQGVQKLIKAQRKEDFPRMMQQPSLYKL
ncbi:17339_t:CDS:2 [Funneliformis caledonium]|uniref:17339_t:CDS:1 n=1 Tax=Funneliformis caledonium TaxID=1117310 RepID=A0A9N9B7Z4_9GLOM|nr:17339_t:CDS:2 [Funneliformis caledonium]